ncbi:MAG: hypothetical protein OEY77_04180 [Nitrospira sp.]|nr:hypothetical protein [Nitrospira sp.]
MGSTVDSQNSAEDAKRTTQQQTERIEGQLKDLGNKIQALHSSSGLSNAEKEIEEIQGEYNAIADAFYKNLPIEVEEHKGRNATKTIQQLEATRKIESHVHRLESLAQGLVSAFNSKNHSKSITISSLEFPVNLFDPSARGKYQTLLSFAQDSHWSIRFVWYPDGTPALEFIRLTSQDKSGKDREFFMTSDSIQLVLMGGQFRSSLNQSISDDLKDRVMKDIPQTVASMENFDGAAKAILEAVIKYQLLQQSLKP